MIDTTTTRICAWLLQINGARTMWSNEKIAAEQDNYLESIEFHYNGINRR